MDDLKAMIAGQSFREVTGIESLAVTLRLRRCWSICLPLLLVTHPKLEAYSSLACYFALSHATPRRSACRCTIAVSAQQGIQSCTHGGRMWLTELIISTGKKDWVINMGIVVSKDGSE